MVDSRSEPAWAWPDLHDAQRAVLLEVLINGSASRAELARRTGLSRTSLTRLARDLVELGLLTEGETNAPNGRGRPSEILNLEPSAAQFAGVKLTGEALYAVVTDLRAGVIEIEEQSLVSRYAPDVVTQIAETVSRFSASHPRLASVGVCLAGDVQQVRGRSVIVGSHFLGWDNVPLESLVEAETGLPIAMSNDVQALTAAHHWFGAGVGRRSLVLFGLGAGIGAGIVVNDELVRGSHGHPGKSVTSLCDTAVRLAIGATWGVLPLTSRSLQSFTTRPTPALSVFSSVLPQATERRRVRSTMPDTHSVSSSLS